MQNSKGHISAKHAPNPLPKTSLKSLFLRLCFCVEIILVSGFFGAHADSTYHCFGNGIWARHEPEPKHSGPQLIPKPRDYLISCGWKIYSCCNRNNSTEDNNTKEENMCKFLYSTEEFALLRVIAAILFSKDIRCTGQAQMSWISGDAFSNITWWSRDHNSMRVFILTLFICSIDVTFPKGLLSVEVRCAKSHIRPVIIRSSSSFKFSFLLKKEGCWYVSKTDVRWRPFIKPFVLFNSRLNSIFYEANQQSMPLLIYLQWKFKIAIACWKDILKPINIGTLLRSCNIMTNRDRTLCTNLY